MDLTTDFCPVIIVPQSVLCCCVCIFFFVHMFKGSSKDRHCKPAYTINAVEYGIGPHYIQYSTCAYKNKH